MDLSFSTTGSILAVKMLFNDTNTEDKMPADVPTREKSISPLMPKMKPRITTIRVLQVRRFVGLPRIK
jgi:hypothetical protein